MAGFKCRGSATPVRLQFEPCPSPVRRTFVPELADVWNCFNAVELAPMLSVNNIEVIA